eukprot:104322-Rhodomonas_salina.1
MSYCASQNAPRYVPYALRHVTYSLLRVVFYITCTTSCPSSPRSRLLCSDQHVLHALGHVPLAAAQNAR